MDDAETLRRKNIERANGTLALSGLSVTEEAMRQNERYIAGEITLEQAIQEALKRHQKAK